MSFESWMLFWALANGATGLSVETGSPDALCPDLLQTQAAVSARLGALIVQGGRGWRARYTIGHDPESSQDFVRLELFDPEGHVRLVRDLPMAGESCATMADVIALILDRFFRRLDSSDPQPEGEPLDEQSPSRSAPSPAQKLAEPPKSRTAPPPRRQPPAEESRANVPWIVAAELGATSYPAGPAVGVHAFGNVWRELSTGFALIWPLSQDEAPLASAGEARLDSLVLRGHFGWGPRFGRWSGYLGPAFSLALQRGSTVGVANEGSRYRLVWGLGVATGVAFRLGERWFLTASGAAELTVPAWSGQFWVQREVLPPEPRQVHAAVGIGYAFF